MVTIEQHVWGMTPEGEAIILYTMRNDKGAEVKISNFGAAIVSVTMPDREGRMADVALGYDDFNHIRDFKGYDHPFVIDGWQPNILGEVGELREKGSGRCVKILSSQPSVMVYTGNWLAGGCPETKTGGRYDDYDGVAIECQNYPDAVNHPDFPSPLLRPGELYCQKIVFRFGTF